jgi:hypothetical protein
MAAVGTRFDFDLGVVRFSEYDGDGFLGIQMDAYGDDDETGAPTVELQYPFGFVSRPADPDVDPTTKLALGASVLMAADGNERHAWLASDPRTIPLLPQLQKGSSMQFGSDGSFCTLDPVTRQWTVYVVLAQGSDGLATSALLIQAGKDTNNDDIFTVVHPSGAHIDIDKDGKINLVSPNGQNFLSVSDTGVTVSGALKATSIDSGPSGTAGQPLLQSPAFLLWAAQVAAAVNALAPGSVTLPPGTPTVTTLGT